MSERDDERGDAASAGGGPEDFGTLTVEDDPAGTTDPGELAHTADQKEADEGYQPESTVADPESS